MDVENILSTASEEDLTKLRQALKPKSKYQKKGVYREKENKVRFFNPDEYEKFIYAVSPKWRNYYWFLMLTGLRYKEAKNVKVGDIDFANKQIIILKPKGGVQRYCHLSSYGVKLIRQWKMSDNLKEKDMFSFPTIQHLIQLMKKTCKEQGIKDYPDFSVHNLRKTHENYLLALGKDEMKLTRHMGHTPKTAQQHYLSSAFIKDKSQLDKIRTWLSDIFE